MKYLFFIFVFSIQILNAQTTFSSDEEEENTVGPWEISGNFGYYQASQYHAEFYNGAPYNVNNVDYVFGNYYWYN